MFKRQDQGARDRNLSFVPVHVNLKVFFSEHLQLGGLFLAPSGRAPESAILLLFFRLNFSLEPLNESSSHRAVR